MNNITNALNEHIRRGHWLIVPLSQVPPNTCILESVWSMKRKMEIISRKIYKWKVRLNLHGGQQEKGVNYNNTYSPVVGWFSICLLLALSLLSKPLRARVGSLYHPAVYKFSPWLTPLIILHLPRSVKNF